MQRLIDNTSDVLPTVKKILGRDCPHYQRILEAAVQEVPPVWLRSEYLDFFWHCATTIPNWLPTVLLACARTEGNGSHGLLKMWAGVRNHEKAEVGLLRHAKDESGHARLFIKLASLCFPRSYSPGTIEQSEQSIVPIERDSIAKSCDVIQLNMLIDYMMQLNIVEMRTLHHLKIMAPMYYELCPTENREKVRRILESLERDESRHIAYTAEIIDEWYEKENDDIGRLTDVFICRLVGYNQHTLDHCDDAKNDYGQGRYLSLFAH